MPKPLVRHIMGTVFSIDVRDREVEPAVAERAIASLTEADRRFSPFDDDSELSRMSRGVLTLEQCHPDMREVLALCEELRVQSGGAFNAWRARRDGRLDPSGIVKGWALDRATAILAAGGARNFAVNGGGDVLVRGHPEPGRGWRVGIRHPHDGLKIAAVLELSNAAVATSGSYERGPHIFDARSGQVACGLSSLTVIGPTMTAADGYATAGYAMGEAGIEWVAAQPEFGVYALTVGGRARYNDLASGLIRI